MSFQHILIAVEGAPLALKVAAQGFDLARAINANVTLVHVLDPSLAIGEPDIGQLPEQAMEVLRKQGQDLITQLIDSYGQDLTIQHYLPQGKPVAETLQMIESISPDIVVLGTHSRSFLGKLIEGSVFEQITRRCPCPVMVVHQESL